MIRVKTKELEVGMVVAEPIKDPSTGKLLLTYDTRLTNDLIASIKSHGITEIGVLEKFTVSMNPIETTRKELKQFMQAEIKRLVSDKPEANPSDVITDIAKKSLELINKILENDDIISFCVQMKLLDNDYLYRHCINTSVLSILVSGALGLDTQAAKNIGEAALLHDIGLCEMPFLVRTPKRNSQEETLYEEHPRYGYYFAKEKFLENDVTKLILHHHELWNGSGFPDKLSGKDIPIGSRIICVCETYDRLLRYDKYPQYQAIEYLYGAGNYFFDSDVVNAFTNNLSVYPLGSLVRLSSGEVGVVVNVRKNLGPRPIVRVYFNTTNRPIESPKDIDLGQERTIFIKELL